MKIFVNKITTPQEAAAILQEAFPAYKIEVKKNPILRFEYVQVAKTSFVGA